MFKRLQQGLIRSSPLTTLILPRTTTSTTMPLRPLYTISGSIVESLKKEEIFDDVIPAFTPAGLLQVSYGDSNEVAMGNTLKVADTQKKPQFQFVRNVPSSSSEEKSVEIKDQDLFTLVLTDPDAPSRTDKKWSEYAHFVTTDIALKSNDSTQEFLAADLDLSKQGTEVLEYVGPAPPSGTGKHRYVFLLFKQTPGITPQAPKDRPNWGFGTPATGVLKWSQEYKLEPYAVNFFKAEEK